MTVDKASMLVLLTKLIYYRYAENSEGIQYPQRKASWKSVFRSFCGAGNGAEEDI